MASEKQVTLFGLLSGIEGGGYGTGNPSALAPATDGVLLMEPAIMTPDYIDDGERGLQPGAAGQMIRSAKSGRFAEFTPRIAMRGRGLAYSSINVPPDLHEIIQICGHQATNDTTPSNEKWTYAPESGPTGFSSGEFRGYSRGQAYDMLGAYGSLQFNFSDVSAMFFEPTIMGFLNLPTDVALPSITYVNATLQPPKMINVALSLNAVTGWKLRSFSFNQNRELSPRADSSGTGHSGFTPGRREPTVEMVVEARALATFNPFSLANSSTTMALSFTGGTVQYNRMKFDAAAFQITEVEDDEDGATALWRMTGVCAASTPIAEDDYTLTFD